MAPATPSAIEWMLMHQEFCRPQQTNATGSGANLKRSSTNVRALHIRRSSFADPFSTHGLNRRRSAQFDLFHFCFGRTRLTSAAWPMEFPISTIYIRSIEGRHYIGASVTRKSCFWNILILSYGCSYLYRFDVDGGLTNPRRSITRPKHTLQCG